MREDFAKSARRDVIEPFHMKMHFWVLVVALEKKCWCIGGIKKKIIRKIFWGEAGTFGGGGGGSFPPPPTG